MPDAPENSAEPAQTPEQSGETSGEPGGEGSGESKENPPSPSTTDPSVSKPDDSTAPGPEPDWQLPAVNVENRTEPVYAGANGAPDFTDVDDAYFDDALFIGDSRTDGLSLYGGISGATFFCTTGMNVFKLFSEQANVPGVGSTTLESLLANRTFGKIYIMLGLNELGDDLTNIVTQYYAVVEKIHSLQPDALLMIQGNMHVGYARSKSDVWFNNSRINALNYELSKLADNKRVFYIDVNERFDDQNGHLPENVTYDQIHLYGKYYLDWTAWLKTKGVAAGT